MTVALIGDRVSLIGDCGSGDVELLLEALSRGSDQCVDLSETEHLHAAILQVLLTFRVTVIGTPRDTFVRMWLIRVLTPKKGT